MLVGTERCTVLVRYDKGFGEKYVGTAPYRTLWYGERYEGALSTVRYGG